MPENDSVVAEKATIERAATTTDVVLAIATREPTATASVHAALERARQRGLTTALFHADFGTRADTALIQEVARDGTPVKLATLTTDNGAVPPTLAARADAMRALLAWAQQLQARAVVVVDPARSEDDTVAASLLSPVLDGAADFALPLHARHRFEGGFNSGVVYPLTRALFGRQVRQPLLHEFACSRTVVDLLASRSWPLELSRHGAEYWLLTTVLASPSKILQVHVAGAPQTAVGAEPLNQVVARVVGAIFAESERQAAVWQRVRASRPVETMGTAAALGSDPPVPTAEALAAADAFRLAQRNLTELWGMIMPPQTLLDLRRISAAPPHEFRLPDVLWSHVVYDFMLAFRGRRLNRDHLASAFTPLYLGWFGALVTEYANASPQVVEDRFEQLCRTFEEQKPYVIARWRSPDRFNP